MNCLIVISHGSGCEMMSVSLIRELVKTNKYSSIYVTAVNKYFADCLRNEFPDVVYSIDRNELPTIFTTIMMDKDNWEVFNNEVYGTSDFTLRKDNFYDSLRALWKMDRKNDWDNNGSSYEPYLQIPEYFENSAKDFSQQHPKFIMFQRAGGINPVANHEERMRAANSPEQGLKRSYPIDKSEKLVELLVKDGYEVLQYALPEEPHIKGTIYLNQEQNQLLYHALAKYSKGVICIDSSLMHLTIKDAPKQVVIALQSMSGKDDFRGLYYKKSKKVYDKNYKPTAPYFNGIPESTVINYPDPKEVYEAFVEKKSK